MIDVSIPLVCAYAYVLVGCGVAFGVFLSGPPSKFWVVYLASLLCVLFWPFFVINKAIKNRKSQ